MRDNWIEAVLEDVLDYIQPTNYIVDSTEYSNAHKIPVLTAGKSFILGFTSEEHNVFSELPVIIFDDFTTATQFVNFRFKVKSSAMKILSPKSSLVNLKYVYYYMQTIRHNSDTHKRYWISIYSKLCINLAPLPEQRAIVAKIEELFSELDNGVANLNKAKEKLEIYRQAVLKKAFEGELTKEWRVRNLTEEICDKLSSATSFNELSYANWKYKSLSEVCDAIGGHAFKSKDFCKENGKYQVIRIGNIRPGRLRLNESPVYVNALDENLISKYELKIRDVVITLTGTRKKRDYGYTAIVNKTNLLLNQRIAALRFNEKCLPEFFLYYSWTDIFKNQFFESETGNVGQGNVGMKAIRDTLIPLPTIEEQLQIVSLVDEKLSVCDDIEKNLNESLSVCATLRQSILKQAFEGKLLSEEEIRACEKESDWENAEILLSKIKNELRSVK